MLLLLTYLHEKKIFRKKQTVYRYRLVSFGSAIHNASLEPFFSLIFDGSVVLYTECTELCMQQHFHPSKNSLYICPSISLLLLFHLTVLPLLGSFWRAQRALSRSETNRQLQTKSIPNPPLIANTTTTLFFHPLAIYSQQKEKKPSQVLLSSKQQQDMRTQQCCFVMWFKNIVEY